MHAVIFLISFAGQNVPGVVASEFVFEKAPHPQCHASTIVQTDQGFVSAWFGGTREKHQDVGIWLSRKIDGKWTAPTEVANGVQSPELRHPCWNPILFQPGEGPLLLFYKVGPSPSSWWGMLKTSEDGGKTWSEGRKLGKDAKVGHLLGPVKNKPVQLKDGSILCPTSTEHEGWRVHFELTRDLGKTWEVIGPINDGREFGAIQPSILHHANGKMQVLCRSKQNVITQSWSEDGGKTWGKMTVTTLPNPNAGTDAVTLSDGRQLLVYNHTIRKSAFPSGRNMLNIAVSSDGVKWKAAAVLERAKGEYSYPAVIQSDDGLVHITYTWQRTWVRHAVIDPARLELKPIEEGKWPD